MLEKVSLDQILFLDIETVPQSPTFDQVPADMQEFWQKKARYLRTSDTDTADSLYERAGIYAEFGKIVCISIAMFHDGVLRVKSFAEDHEKQLLTQFAELLSSLRPSVMLCAHNGKEFDFPYIARRMLINELALPQFLDNAGKKPWEVNHLDTLELWKFGDYKSYTSLALLATVLGIPTPKDDIDGSMVASVYWKEHDLDRIKIYCQKDVITLAQLLLKFKGQPLLDEDKIIYV